MSNNTDTGDTAVITVGDGNETTTAGMNDSMPVREPLVGGYDSDIRH